MELQFFYRLIEEEIRHYQELLNEVRRETTYLRGNSVETLIKSVHIIEERTRAIEATHRSIQQRVKEILLASGAEPDPDPLKIILSLLTPADSHKIKLYQKSLERLKTWIVEINQRNKGFIRDSLNYWKDLFSLATGSGQQAPVYVQNGQKKASAHQPFSLDRKV